MIRVEAFQDPSVLSALHAMCFDDAWDTKAFAELLDMSGCQAWIALQGQNPCGLLMIRRVLDEAEVITIGTIPTARRQGVAIRLLAQAISELSGCRTLFLEVSERNAAAAALYAAQGFVETGRRRAYYRDGSDALVMTRSVAISCDG